MKIIFERRHPALIAKTEIWKLLSDAYVGGMVYSQGDHLFRYPRENARDYDARKKRSVYFNAVQPLADILTGLLYLKEPERKIPSNLSYLVEQCSKGLPLNQFIQLVAVHSLLYTVGILVDSPKFDPELVKSQLERKEMGLNPYCKMYMPWEIRDYYLDDRGKLEWIILDNSYLDSSDPLVAPVRKSVYRLWTKSFFQDFEMISKDEIKASEEYPHNLGEVPFILQSWRDMNEDKIADSPFEDIALIDRQIFNLLSYLDEMLAAGTFKVLFFPGDPPDGLVKEGLGNLTVVSFDPASSKGPYFDGAKLEDISPFLEALQIYRKAQLEKVGLDKDQEKAGVQSGVAKRLEYRKAQAILKFGAESLERTEKEIFRIAALWEKSKSEVEIKYQENWDAEDIDAEVKRLVTVFEAVPFEKMRKAVAKQIATKSFSDSTELKSILDSIEGEDSSESPSQLAIEMAKRFQNTSPPDGNVDPSAEDREE